MYSWFEVAPSVKGFVKFFFFPPFTLLIEMAAKPSSSSGLLKLEDELTCPVCLDLYTNPKTLPCLHSCCQKCLERFPQDKEGETYYLSCPICRKRTELPEGGAGAFPAAFTLNNLKETHSLLKAILVSSPVSDPQQETCSVHLKPLEVFCGECVTVICHYCALRNHINHKCELVTDCYPKHYQKLKESLKPIKGKMEALNQVLSVIAKGEAEIREEEEKVLQEIQSKMEEMINALHQSEKKLSEQVKRVSNARLQGLAEQRQSVENNLKVLKDIEDYVEQNLETGTRQQLLSFMGEMMERINEVVPGINVEELQPIEEEDFELTESGEVNEVAPEINVEETLEKDNLQLIKNGEVVKSLHNIGDIVTVLQQCKMKKIRQVKALSKEKKVLFLLSIETSDSFLISVPISSLKCSLVPVGKDEEPIHTTVTTTSTPGVYKIHCNPSTSGTHTVKVLVYNSPLEDTSLAIPINPTLRSITPVRTIPNIKSPWGVAVSDDGYIIVDGHNDANISILDREGKVVTSYNMPLGIFVVMRGIAVAPDNFIIVADKYRIHKMNMNGEDIKSVGRKGSGPLEFRQPAGLAISPVTGLIYVADRGNHRVQVLNPDLTFSHTFGCRGSGDGEFNCPNDVAIDSQWFVYVTDRDNNRIQKFTPEGGFKGYFGDRGCLDKPGGIAIDTAGTGLVYVSSKEYNCVSVFTSEGAFVCRFGRNGKNIDEFNGPRELAFDKEGFLYICDHVNNRLVIY